MHPNTQPRRLLEVCIPAYNRPNELAALLASIVRQSKAEQVSVLVVEDCSPRRDEICNVLQEFRAAHPLHEIRLVLNEQNLGYDRNVRRAIELAGAEYCMLFGDDDVLADGALEAVLNVIEARTVGFVLRAWQSVDKRTRVLLETFRYFPEDRLFPPGEDSAAALFRRSVYVSGLTFRTERARQFSTSQFDGTLLYQLYLVARIAREEEAYYLNKVVAYRSVGGEHFFGSSESERGKFSPKELTAQHSVNFVKGMFSIATVLGALSPTLTRRIVRDLSRYSYPLLEIQIGRGSRVRFSRYAFELAGLGLGRSPFFWAYYLGLLVFGPKLCNAGIRYAKRLLGSTPNLGGSAGRPAR